MAGGGFVNGAPLKRAHLYEYKITGYFITACIVAALGGSLFGYDLGVSGMLFSFHFCLVWRNFCVFVIVVCFFFFGLFSLWVCLFI